MARSSRRVKGPGYASTVTSGLLICCSVAIALLGYIRLKDDLNRLQTEIGQLDRGLARLRRSNEKLRLDYEVLVSSAGLDNRVRQMGLNLVRPGDDARIILPEPRLPTREAAGSAAAGRDAHIALYGYPSTEGVQRP